MFEMICDKCHKRMSRDRTLRYLAAEVKKARDMIAVKFIRMGMSEYWIQENLYRNDQY